jgi:hypothetical protein
MAEMVPKTEAGKMCRSVKTPTRVVEKHNNGGDDAEDRSGKNVPFGEDNDQGSRKAQQRRRWCSRLKRVKWAVRGIHRPGL